MQQQELNNIVHLKNSLIVKQNRRISLLEEKLTELRHKYFRLHPPPQFRDERLFRLRVLCRRALVASQIRIPVF